jgi:hypothetical protein
MNQDISDILRSWEFDPAVNVRRIWGEDGVQKIQVRVDQGAFQGILQLNLDGRPDCKKPYGMDFALDYFRGVLERFRSAHGGDDRGFTLDREACKELFDESSRVYGRYVFLLQLNDYQRVIRDTERNMELFRFVNTYAENEEDRVRQERWWPYILRIHATARARQAADRGEYEQALAMVAEAQERIGNLPAVEAEEFFVERDRSRQALTELAEELNSRKPRSHRELLEQRLQEAVEREEFERAAVIRDELKRTAGAGSEPAREG